MISVSAVMISLRSTRDFRNFRLRLKVLAGGVYLKVKALGRPSLGLAVAALACSRVAVPWPLVNCSSRAIIFGASPCLTT